jgi:hypothetical protein
MFGLFGVCAAAGVLATTVAAASNAIEPSQICLIIDMIELRYLSVGENEFRGTVRSPRLVSLRHNHKGAIGSRKISL